MRLEHSPLIEPPLPLTKRTRDALRAIVANPGGLRFTAYPSVMPELQERALVRVREAGRPAWLLTEAGRRVVRDLNLDRP